MAATIRLGGQVGLERAYVDNAVLEEVGEHAPECGGHFAGHAVADAAEDVQGGVTEARDSRGDSR